MVAAYPNADPPDFVADYGVEKDCPECRHRLTRYKVGHGLNFFIDRCAYCGGVWLDRYEWEVLKGHHLHDHIDFVFSQSWQADVKREGQDEEQERRLIERFGEDDLAEIRRIKAWLEAHPKRHELMAFLIHPAK